jgi:hypothetical protein
MKFVEETGSNWTAHQIKAVEQEIEQQKRQWEEKRLAQRQQEELEKQRAEKDDNEILTYSREDASNKVNIKTKKKLQVLGKRKFEEKANHSTRKSASPGKKSNGVETIQNGTEKVDKKSVSRTPPKKSNELRATRNTRNQVNQSAVEEKVEVKVRRPPIVIQRSTSRKSDRSTSNVSKKSRVRSTSESTSRSTADSMSLQTSVTTGTMPDDSDSECSLDVMIDSNDVNDSDSNSNHNVSIAKRRSCFDSTSRDGDTIINDDSTMTDETTIEQVSKSFKENTEENKVASSPRTRSRGTVNVNLWTLDDSPILPVKRQKLSLFKNSSDAVKIEKHEEKELKANFGVKECKVSVIDINQKSLSKPSPKSRAQKKLQAAKNNHTLDSWLQKPSATASKTASEDPQLPSIEKEEVEERIPVTRQRRNTILHKTL